MSAITAMRLRLKVFSTNHSQSKYQSLSATGSLLRENIAISTAIFVVSRYQKVSSSLRYQYRGNAVSRYIVVSSVSPNPRVNCSCATCVIYFSDFKASRDYTMKFNESMTLNLPDSFSNCYQSSAE